jgi:hypothetical protein
VRDAQKNELTTLHNVYTSGLFEETSAALDRVLEEVKRVEQSADVTTLHNVYTSGIFEDEASQ